MTAQEIKRLRLRLNLSQEALAEKLDITSQSVSRWERGLFHPTALALKALLKLSRKSPRHF